MHPPPIPPANHAGSTSPSIHAAAPHLLPSWRGTCARGRPNPPLVAASRRALRGCWPGRARRGHRPAIALARPPPGPRARPPGATPSRVTAAAQVRPPLPLCIFLVCSPRREPAAEISRNQTKPQGPSQTGGEVAAKRARGEGGTGRRQCRRCRAGARRTARSRTPPPSASPTSTPTSRSAVESSCPHPS